MNRKQFKKLRKNADLRLVAAQVTLGSDQMTVIVKGRNHDLWQILNDYAGCEVAIYQSWDLMGGVCSVTSEPAP